MKLYILLVVLAVASADQKWYNLRTTWMFNPLDSLAFAAQPRTVAEAEAEGWIELDSYCDLMSASFRGRRWIRNANDIQMVLLFDVNGFIAGMQSPVPVANTYDNQYFDYEGSPAYVKTEVNGVEVYVTTAYFVDPEIICTTGRTQEQFDVEGTGTDIYLQNGPDYLAVNLIKAPQTEDEIVAEGVWFKHFCFLNMGNHFFQYDYTQDQDCNKVFPAQLVYEDNLLKGFVWQHVADIAGDRWEQPDGLAIGAIVDRPPTCLNSAVNTPGLRTMHVYLTDYTDLCIV